VAGKGGADMVGASALACSSDFLLRLAGCQSQDLVAEVRRTALAASGLRVSAGCVTLQASAARVKLSVFARARK